MLEHARGCPACRAHLDELAVVAQEILTAAPAHEPPPGFESRVLDALLPRSTAAPPAAGGGCCRRSPPRAARAGGATWVTLSATREERGLGAHYREVLATAGGKYLAARELRDAAGAKRGVVFAYQGDQPWVTVVLAAAAGDEPWRVGISTRDGAARELGVFDPATAGRVWGHALPVAVREVASVRPDRRGRPRAARAAAVPLTRASWNQSHPSAVCSLRRYGACSRMPLTAAEIPSASSTSAMTPIWSSQTSSSTWLRNSSSST